MKDGYKKDTQGNNSPDVLWYYSDERQAQILTLTVKNMFQLQWQNPYTDTLWKWAIYPTYYNLGGMNGFTFENQKPNFHFMWRY